MAIGQFFFSIQKKKKIEHVTRAWNLHFFQKWALQIVVLATRLASTPSPDILETLSEGDTAIDLCPVQIVSDVNLKKSNATAPWLEAGKRNWIVKPALLQPFASWAPSWREAELFPPLGPSLYPVLSMQTLFPSQWSISNHGNWTTVSLFRTSQLYAARKLKSMVSIWFLKHVCTNYSTYYALKRLHIEYSK